MDVAVLGATGDVGRQVCTQLIERRVLPVSSRLQLVGRPGGPSGRAVHGLRTDLVDAYDEVAPLLDVALAPADVVADVVVVCAGRTSPAAAGGSLNRAQLAADNAVAFAEYAEALARHGSGHEVVIVVSNPVELGVGIFARALGRHRVIGMGAWLDTLRFRREIAASLGVRRQRVGGFVAGQHGSEMVPLWSTVRVRGHDEAESAGAVAALRGARSLDGFDAEIAAAQDRLTELAARDIDAAFALIDSWPPDLRAVTRPWMTHQSGAKTAAATASATVELVDTVLDGRDIVVAGQVALDGEVPGLDGVLGVPVVIGPEGWRRVMLDDVADDERRRLAQARDHIGEMLAAHAVGGGPGTRAGDGERPEGAAPGADEGTPADARVWVLEVLAGDRPGSVSAISGVFATRGVSVDSLVTNAAAGGPTSVTVTFAASPQRQQLLTRTLGRLAMVRGVIVRERDRDDAS